MTIFTTNSTGIDGRVLRRGEEKYEYYRRGAVWHAGVPERYPEIIVVATSATDVRAAVTLAATEGLQVAVRSGGHSWSGSHLRDGSLLIDMSNLRRVEVDVEAMTAVVEPGITGWELASILRDQNLFFPTGHSEGIAVGGYLLQGGFGWMGRAYGPACMSVTGIEAVTADGELLTADETHNADLLWAARGAGPGFFAVVTKFRLRLYPLRRVVMNSTYVYPASVIPELLEFIHGVETPAEFGVLIRRHESVGNELIAVLNVIAFTDDDREARRQLAVFDEVSFRPRAIQATTFTPMDFSHTDTDGGSRDEELRWVADNMATHAEFSQLAPGLDDILARFPEAPSHLLLFNWGGYESEYARPDMAFSVEDRLFYGLYAAWPDSAHDQEHIDWVTEGMRAWEPFASGTMLADENLLNRPYRFVSDDNLRRLDALRSRWDAGGRFVSWLGRPTTP